jgi:hypothetical protein
VILISRTWFWKTYWMIFACAIFMPEMDANAIQVSPDSLAFVVPAPYGNGLKHTFTIKNNESSVLNVSGITFTNEIFRVSPAPPYTIQPDSLVQVEMELVSPPTETLRSFFTIGFNGPFSVSKVISIQVADQGNIVTVAGGGPERVDGSHALNSALGSVRSVFVHNNGDIYFVEVDSSLVRRIDFATGKIYTVAGGGTNNPGDGGLATDAELLFPMDVFVDGSDNIYIADTNNHRIRKVDTAGVITTIAGFGSRDFSGDGGPAVRAGLNRPQGVFVKGSEIYIADTSNQRVRKIDASGVITTVAGNGAIGEMIVSQSALSGGLVLPSSVFVDDGNNIYITSSKSNFQTVTHQTEGVIVEELIVYPTLTIKDRVYKVNASGNVVQDWGNGSVSDLEGGPADRALFFGTVDAFVDSEGNLFVTEFGGGGGNHLPHSRVRKIDTSGIIRTIAGVREDIPKSTGGYSGDGGAGTNAKMHIPSGLFVDKNGDVYIADTFNNRIRRVTGVAAPTQLIPVDPKISVSVDTLQYSRVPDTLAIKIANSGGSELVVSDMAFSDGAFRVDPVPPYTLQPNEEITVHVIMASDPMTTSGILTIRSNDPAQSEKVVVLQATLSLLAAGEYFLGTDPGFGQGISIPVDVTRTTTKHVTISKDQLTPGFHTLNVRFKDFEGRWGLTTSRTLYVGASETPRPITAVEYYFDTDPGRGSGNQVGITAADSIVQTATLDAKGLARGFHTVYARALDVNGWGLTTSRTLYVGDSEQPSPVAGLEYFIGNEPGVGKGTAIEVDQADSVTVTSALATAALDTGNHVVTVRARNAIGNWGLGTKHVFSVQVGNVAPSVIDSVGPLTLARGETVTRRLGGVFVDADGDTMSFSAVSSDEAIATVLVGGDSAKIAGVARGSATVLLAADDGNGHLVNLPVAVTVPNALPVAVADTVTIEAGGRVNVSVLANDTDVDGDALTVAGASGGANTERAVLNSDNTVHYRPNEGFSGTDQFTYTVDDGNGGTATGTVTVIVGTPNALPVVVQGLADVSLTLGTDPLVLDLGGVFRDGDEDALTYSVSSSDTAVATAHVVEKALHVTPVAEGLVTVVVTASDGKGGSVGDTLQVAVVTTPNAVPIVAQGLSDVSLTLGGDPSEKSLAGVFTDADGDTLSYSATSSNEAVATAGVSGNTLRITPIVEGTATVVVIASDGKGGSARDTLQVTVTDVPFSGTLLTDLNASADNQNVVSTSVKAGDTVTVQLYASDFPTITGFGFTLTYDPAVLTFVSNSFQVGDFLSGVTPLVTDQNGKLEIGAAALGGGTSGSGDGLLGAFAFEVGPAFSKSSQITLTSLGVTLSTGTVKNKALEIVLSLTEKSGLAGDFNGDGSVGFPDFLAFASAFGKEDAQFDLTGDGQVGFPDFLVFAANFGKSAKVVSKPVVGG